MKLSIEKLKELLPDARPDRRGKDLRAKCPYCGHDEFGISTEDNHLWGCYRKKKCGQTGNIFTLAKLLNRMDLLNIEGEVGQVEKLENKIQTALDVELDLTLPDITLPVGWRRVFQDDYLDSRGFDAYDRFKVGRTVIDPRFKKHYVIFAIEQEGSVKGYIGRHIWDKKKIESENEIREAKGERKILRYINSDTDFSKLLLGYDEIVEGVTKTIIVVEGLFDKVNTDKLLSLYDQDEIKCNATFKCDISPEQMLMWKNKGIETLILFYDPDVIKDIKKAAASVDTHFNTLIAFNEQGDDPGDITHEQLEIVLSNLKSPTDFFINKINIQLLIN